MHARAGEPVVQRVHGRFFQFLKMKKSLKNKNRLYKQ